MRVHFLAFVLASLVVCGTPALGVVSTGFDFPVGDANGGGWNTTAGYWWLQWTGSVYHPGEDWNKNGTSGDGDMGEPVFAASEGTVIASGNYGAGWGNIVLVEHRLPDGSTVWSQYAHLQQIHVGSGDVSRRQQIGTVGDNFGMYAAHLHFELRTQYRAADAWVSGWSQAQIQNYYVRPSDYINARRSLCTPASVSWTSTPPQNVWYNTDRQLVYSVAGTGPPSVTESPSGAVGDGIIWLSQGGQGPLRDYTVTVSNACGSDSRTWRGGYDTVAPSTNFSGPATSAWLPAGSQVAWNPTDGTSGVGSSSFVWDNGSTNAHIPEGVHGVTVSATDNAGNNVTETHGPYWLDTSAPSISLSGPATSTWMNKAGAPYSVTWSATDATSGILDKKLTWDNGGQTNASPAAIPEGKRSATVWAKDNATNEASQTYGPWWVDTTPPVPGVAFSPSAPNGENGWYVSDPTMTVVATDPNGADGSGVNGMFYSLDGGAEAPFTIPVLVSGDGIHTCSARATDVAGNSGSTGDVIVKVDMTPPVFDSIYTDSESRSLNTLVATWSCSDPDSGIADYQYWIGSTQGADDIATATLTRGANWAYAMNLNLTPGQTCYFTVRAKNVAGLWSIVVHSAQITANQGGYDASSSLNMGGVSVSPRTSANYRIVDSIGQFVVDASSSANYIVEHGYWHTDLATVEVDSVGAAKAMDNGKTIQLGSALEPVVVTAGTSTFAGRFYVEQPDRSSGMAVQYGPAVGPTLVEGDQVWLLGKTDTLSGERVIKYAEPHVVGHLNSPLAPLFMVVPNLGGGDLNNYTPGVLDGIGLNNIGLLVRTYGGLVSHRDTQGRFFYLDNGDDLYDGYRYGIRIICDGFAGGGKLTMPSFGQSVVVTGISAVVTVNGKPARAIMPRYQSDIVPVH